MAASSISDDYMRVGDVAVPLPSQHAVADFASIAVKNGCDPTAVVRYVRVSSQGYVNQIHREGVEMDGFDSFSLTLISTYICT